MSRKHGFGWEEESCAATTHTLGGTRLLHHQQEPWNHWHQGIAVWAYCLAVDLSEWESCSRIDQSYTHRGIFWWAGLAMDSCWQWIIEVPQGNQAGNTGETFLCSQAWWDTLALPCFLMFLRIYMHFWESHRIFWITSAVCCSQYRPLDCVLQDSKQTEGRCQGNVQKRNVLCVAHIDRVRSFIPL